MESSHGFASLSQISQNLQIFKVRHSRALHPFGKNDYVAAMKAALSFRSFLFVAAVTVAAAILLSLIDDNLGLAWPTNVMRNWQEFGLLHLHGELISNPGGFEATTHPQVYRGMSPVFLYLVYFVTQVFSWTGLDTLAFHIVLLLAVLWGTWNLLGRDDFALIVAVAAVLCPGYMRWPKILDPNTVAVLPVIPYAVIALAILKRPKITPALAVTLLLLTVAFMSLNWTTAWVCGPCIVLFLGMPGVNRRGLIFLTAVMMLGIPAVVATSLAAKASTSAPTGIGAMGPGQVLGSYTWGSGGYGGGLTTGRAFVRLAFVNAVGLLPLWLAVAYAVARRIRDGAQFLWLVFAFAPLALTAADIVVMRNYFGHHPWMAGPVLLSGAIFSLALLRVPMVEREKGAGRVSQGLTWALAALCFVYGLAVLAFFRTNETQLLSLAQLVREHTARSDTIVIVSDMDAGTARLADRLDEPLDRRVIMVNDVKDLSAEKDRWVILSAVRLNDSWKLAAQSAGQTHTGLSKVTDWFNRSISRRSPGDRLELSDTYYLYGPY